MCSVHSPATGEMPCGRQHRPARVFCGMRTAKSCQGVICGKSSAECSAHYLLPLFRILQPKNSAFPQIAKLSFARIARQMCNWSIAASGIPQSLRSIFFVIRLRFAKEQGSVLQFWLTSKYLPHSKCHIISLVDVIGLNLNNRCDSRTDDRTN